MTTTEFAFNGAMMGVASFVTYVLTRQTKGVEIWRTAAEGNRALYDQEKSQNEELKAQIATFSGKLDAANLQIETMKTEIGTLKALPDYATVMRELGDQRRETQEFHKATLAALELIAKGLAVQGVA